uniref:Uncharacterized protein n=1 Tax=Gossypium raimondii TaxID=29730 RepID=A0A0D2SYH0_GOSRA|nr:hypothetical protein B456_006G154300 [Gossypium raimondii]
MLGKKMGSLKKLAKKVKSMRGGDGEESKYEWLLREFEEMTSPTTASTPPGSFAIYVGENEERFVVPTNFLSHPLFKMLLEKSYNEYGFQQRDKLVVPCFFLCLSSVWTKSETGSLSKDKNHIKKLLT